jgi:hypothetical protein
VIEDGERRDLLLTSREVYILNLPPCFLDVSSHALCHVRHVIDIMQPGHTGGKN